MAEVFLLGPSEWDPGRGGGGLTTPMDHRRSLADVFRRHGHVVTLMEDEDDRAGEDLLEKFERLVGRSTDVVVYWPMAAKMATTFDEMLWLRKLDESSSLPRLWFLHHAAVARIERGTFRVLERGGRSRYLTTLARLGITAVPWATETALYERADLLAGVLG